MQRYRLLLGAVVCWGTILIEAASAQPVMRAHHIDVGQGAATLLEFPCGAVLIDTGAQDAAHAEILADYLSDFFGSRPDLNDTLSSLIITHPHIDHTRGIKAVAQVCRIRNYIDSGHVEGSGGPQVQWVRSEVEAGRLNTVVREVSDDEITSLPHKQGLTDEHIDPVECPDCDPKIVVLSGALSENPGWSSSEFENKNNHSVVVRVDFGEASFLFTGDLEAPAIQTLVSYYRHTDMLDVDVYQVGHHGSHNGTNESLVEAMTPEIAVFGVGKATFGQGTSGGFNTFNYGHPRWSVVDLLSRSIPGDRSSPKAVTIFVGSQQPIPFTITKRLYATGWDGTVKIRAELDGTKRVDTQAEAIVVASAARPRSAPRLRAPEDVATQPFDSVVARPLTPPMPSLVTRSVPPARQPQPLRAQTAPQVHPAPAAPAVRFYYCPTPRCRICR